MSSGPPRLKKQYGHRLHGVYGRFGSGAGVEAFYLQTALSPAQLDWVSLISDVRGSERWPVRDLFQRDVDDDRITAYLLPYLQDVEKTKFFNPLTLTLLPMEEDEVLREMPTFNQTKLQEDGLSWEVLERPDYHRVRWIHDEPYYALLEWNDMRTKLVAIDGQHRLSALKRFWKDHSAPSYAAFQTWRLPVVIVSFRVGNELIQPPTMLEVVRSIFVYINTEARQVNPARQILLSDESINAVCTQELVESAHANDLMSPEDRDPRRLPLLFYDWRGEESSLQRVHAPAAVKDVEEIHNWMEHYLLGKDFSDEQAAALHVDRGDNLHKAFHAKKLRYEDSKHVRLRAQEALLPGVRHLLENFTPYKNYVEHLRRLESQFQGSNQSDLDRHAFDELRFGTNQAPEANQDEVKARLAEIRREIERLKAEFFHEPIDREIGMRGVVCAFAELRGCFGNPNWYEYAEWFVRALNRLYADHWLDCRPETPRREFLLHVAYDHNPVTVNYRLHQIRGALGAYLGLLILAFGHPIEDHWDDARQTCKDELSDALRSTLVRGFKREVRPGLKQQEEFMEGGVKLTKAVQKEADKLADKQMRKFQKEIEKIEKAA